MEKVRKWAQEVKPNSPSTHKNCLYLASELWQTFISDHFKSAFYSPKLTDSLTLSILFPPT